VNFALDTDQGARKTNSAICECRPCEACRCDARSARLLRLRHRFNNKARQLNFDGAPTRRRSDRPCHACFRDTNPQERLKGLDECVTRAEYSRRLRKELPFRSCPASSASQTAVSAPSSTESVALEPPMSVRTHLRQYGSAVERQLRGRGLQRAQESSGLAPRGTAGAPETAPAAFSTSLPPHSRTYSNLPSAQQSARK
jgi:hypothetical protein